MRRWMTVDRARSPAGVDGQNAAVEDGRAGKLGAAGDLRRRPAPMTQPLPEPVSVQSPPITSSAVKPRYCGPEPTSRGRTCQSRRRRAASALVPDSGSTVPLMV